ncbi:Bug family tripartite tricarboxylate transporter substrate binding protein [Siccirubricoccus phaeus]|uniref:Bug family tripartite tricarboxylate transporter substrate binding protein n=1 Tax=Siccirubricoccus phaeus TaxID=2595053 RepID=UPI0011F0AFBB|nr:tripartite tricarboxylate transporter substrate binding protein [Siccirubricoccus phaeus]
MNRRSLLAAASLPFLARGARAQGFPTRPIRMVIGFPPGGGSDQVGRPLAQRMPDVLGQPVLVENRGGANGNLALDFTAKSAADGYTICHVNTSVISVNPLLYRSLPFNVLTDLTAVGAVTLNALLVTIPAELPARNLQEFIAYAKARPGQLNFGSGGLGSITHLGYALVTRQAGLDIVHVPYRGSAPALQDMLGGRVQLMVDGVNVSKAMIDAGRVRAIAYLGRTRNPLLPEVPTAAEQGMPELVIESWQGFVAPAATPVEVLDRLEASLQHAVDHADVKAAFSAQGTLGLFQSRATMNRLIREEMERWRPIVADLGVQLD